MLLASVQSQQYSTQIWRFKYIAYKDKKNHRAATIMSPRGILYAFVLLNINRDKFCNTKENRAK